jgi:hypothetical protein
MKDQGKSGMLFLLLHQAVTDNLRHSDKGLGYAIMLV